MCVCVCVCVCVYVYKRIQYKFVYRQYALHLLVKIMVKIKEN